MVNQDSDNYELMSSSELDDLRRQVAVLRGNSLKEGDKARIMIDSMDRLVISINRLITILDDAQKDIIEEYQDSKPAEKLNQLLEQNQAIAKALIAISDNLNKSAPASRSVLPPVPSYQSNAPAFAKPQFTESQYPPMNQQYPGIGAPQNQPMFSMPPTDDLPPMDSIPPLDNPLPTKKKFLGIM